MGFWHDHGVIDFSVCSLRGRNSDVAGAGEGDLPVRLANGQYRIRKSRFSTDRLTRQNICSILKHKNKCSI